MLFSSSFLKVPTEQSLKLYIQLKFARVAMVFNVIDFFCLWMSWIFCFASTPLLLRVILMWYNIDHHLSSCVFIWGRKDWTSLLKHFMFILRYLTEKRSAPKGSYCVYMYLADNFIYVHVEGQHFLCSLL